MPESPTKYGVIIAEENICGISNIFTPSIGVILCLLLGRRSNLVIVPVPWSHRIVSLGIAPLVNHGLQLFNGSLQRDVLRQLLNCLFKSYELVFAKSIIICQAPQDSLSAVEPRGEGGNVIRDKLGKKSENQNKTNPQKQASTCDLPGCSLFC